MGMYHSTYFAYGFQIPDVHPNDSKDLDTQLRRHNAQYATDVGYLTAGDYDRDMTFLTTQCTEIGLGKFEIVTPQTFNSDQYEAWNTALKLAAKSLGIVPREPGWIVVPDLS
ncbi:hypothetical protein OG508_28185 [Streptomyces sp. NBC_01108]|uniref:hypothetical protein n=1 Tax=Streptomyces sp. NBC_01108 TaxID=2903751 RepID=UPI0038738952|nr:hypothetical protein OG508_28185 [Streptomyces sp. NBC_01108]